MGIIAAMEEAQNASLGAESLEQAADQAAVVGEDRAEVTEVAASIDADTGDVEQAAVDVEELQDIGEVAEAAVESGEGLSEQAAEVATIAIERIHQRLGFSGKQRIVPATESFGHANTRLASTKLVLESITDTIKSVWEAIKAMAKRIWDKIVQFFKKIFGSAKSLRDHLENLKKRVGDIKSDATPKEKELTGGMVKKISVKKKADLATYKEIIDNSLKLAKASNGISAASAGVASAVSNMTSQLQGTGITATSVSGFASAMDSTFGKVGGLLSTISTVSGTGIAAKTKTKTGKGTVKSTKTYGPFANGQVIVVEEMNKTVGTGASAITYVTVSISFESVDSKEVAEKAKALNKGEILEVLKLASDACNAAEDMEKNQKELQKIIDESQKSADNVLKAAGKLVDNKGDGNDRVAMNEARDAISGVFSLLNQIGQRIPASLLNAAYAGADYASASIANHR